MCLYFALMYKTLGGYNWTDIFIKPETNETISANVSSLQHDVVDPIEVMIPTVSSIAEEDQFDPIETTETIDTTIFESAKELQSSFRGLKAVSSHIFMICSRSFQFAISFEFNFDNRCLQLMCIAAYSVLQRGGRALFGLPPHHLE